MADSTVQEELNSALAERKALTEKMLSVGAVFTDEEKARLRGIASEIRALESRVYLEYPLPREEEIALLSADELDEIHGSLSKKIRALSQWEYENELSEAQTHELKEARRISTHVEALAERKRADSYDPGPNDPPAYEPRGFAAVRGFVKMRPENNDYYVELYADDPWYPAIREAHRKLSERIPDYNIAQIKEKFGGLRYYYDLPEGSSNELHEFAEQVVREAEIWVNGYSQAIRDSIQRNK